MDCHFTALPNEALLLIEGPDALAFLQGQTTCDTSLVTPEQAVPGAYCTPKGRVVCDFLLVQLGEESFGLRMRRDIVEHAAATFGKYIVFSKADIVPDHDWQVVALWGENAPTLLNERFGATAGAIYSATTNGAGAAVQTDEQGLQFELYLPESDCLQFIADLENSASLGSEESWRANQIEAGIARIESTTVEEFVPQTLNFDLTGHVNFTKGCYTGQEVVARLHYRGKTKRRAFICESPNPAFVGTQLFNSDNERSIGAVANVAEHADGRQLTLVSATIDGAEQGFHLGSPNGPALNLLDLPYELPES